MKKGVVLWLIWSLAAAGLWGCAGTQEKPEEAMTLLDVLESSRWIPEVSSTSYWELQRHSYTVEWQTALQLCLGWPEKPNCRAVLDLEVEP